MPEPTVRVLNLTRNTVLGDMVGVAETSLSRMVGLLRHSKLEKGGGLLIIPSQGVHTIGMRFPIDVLFVDRNWRVLYLRPAMEPYRVSSIRWRARSVIELPAGVIAETMTSVGDELQVED
jgi:uncharacterized membrane protein (UPF0127 family)